MTINGLYYKVNLVYDSTSIRLVGPSMIEIEENQNQGTNNFERLYVRCDNPCIVVDDSLLKNSNNTFSTDKQRKLNKECDKIIITEIDGEKVVFLFELKSNFLSGVETGISQLRSSCFKIHMFLDCIDSFLFNEYDFRVVLASWKPTIEQVLNIIKEEKVNRITDRKKLIKDVFYNDIVRSVIDSNRTVFYSLPLKSKYKYDVPLFFFTIEYAKTTANLELSKIV